ncbi:energy-coupling factor ABC transporter ATP-binding protein [Granulicatella elegans]|uniref:energy-coupling factor ABC transporter ATP-binding protein n=1 Tax=Granulicatella elegans TaxID=137732 RepID=UPI001D1424D8|nr:energy-coupling factor ABC transporter ATP-binding protein [Granulicatella elegans]UEA32285.1 energy-coupling factor ABC transporter ATP-binding protein [Granulicatella elegans]
MDIRFKQVGFAYQAGTPFEMRALHDVTFSVKDGSYVAIIGHTGSGKSTILQHLNALLKPTEGVVELGEKTIDSTTGNKDLKPLRKKVGIVFQFPEAQLFEETVEKDIAFGPKNFGVSEEESLKIAAEVVKIVGLPEEVLKKSPFDLSGGQMRRVAIAGVLAMKPEVLVLDEPTAGLDPKGRLEMMEMFYKLNKEQKMTIVLVTHQMNDVSDYADHVIVIESGNVVKEGSPKEVFADASWLLEKQLGVPTTLAFVEKLKEKGWSTDKMPLTLDELANAILEKRGVNE